ncbi:MAG: serine hydroxymethyltransferase [Weeping tea tree witches'-broom phytoplasma]|uniref:serine hydroxymethyltransferase n=1 Tax=Candidatus Phytoplasma melaleucae TaxID=2982630 RepID=UPI00293B58A1|nr:serine hydroxymethyltransferase [Weeping tea tree witches'-broom phytoplasma]
MSNLKIKDAEIYKLIKQEKHRQNEYFNLIASENFVSQAVLEAQGSVLTNKYSEGYPNKRYYHGCNYVDQVEEIAIARVKKLFNAKYANVQPHSGSQANMAVFQSLLTPNDSILGMSLDCGGHLTHGAKFSFAGTFFQAHSYKVSFIDEIIDYEEIRKIAYEQKPKLIIAGCSSYSRIIDFTKFRKIADEVNAYLMADIAHISGLIACGLHPCPLLAGADVVTSTTHKTLRGPRGGFILTNNESVFNKVNKGVFPGIQGGPLMHVIAAKAVAFQEALRPDFITYQKQVLINAKILADTFQKLGHRLVSGTTDNHLLLLDVKYKYSHLNGKLAADILQKVHIIVNKNLIPFDKEKGFYASGIRFGTSAMTSKGFREAEFIEIAHLIDEALGYSHNENILEKIKAKVLFLVRK